MSAPRSVRRIARLAQLLSLAAVATVSATLAGAQAPAAPDTAKQKAEIAKLSWMVGSWEGDAWIQRGAERTELRQKETVAKRLDGLALLVDGEGVSKTDPSKVLFRALGVLYWDAYANGLRFAAWTNEGYGSVATASVTANGFQWELATGQGKVRYTATHAAGTWTEIGEWSGDGATWSKFFEMKLTKKK